MRKPALLAGAALLALGCGEDFAPEYRLEESRILALQAEPPQPQFGGAPASLHALVYLHGGEVIQQQKWSWCPIATTSAMEYQCPIDAATFERMVGKEAAAAAPLDNLGTGDVGALLNVFPPEVLASLCAGQADAILSGGLGGNPGVGNDAGVADAGVADAGVDASATTADAGTDAALPDPKDAGADADSPDGAGDGGLLASAIRAQPQSGMSKLVTCGSAGYPVSVFYEFKTEKMTKPERAVFRVYLPIDAGQVGNRNPVLNGFSMVSREPAGDITPGQLLDDAGTVALDRDVKYKLKIENLTETESVETFWGWTRDNLGGYAKDDNGQHIIGQAREILTLNWFVEGGKLGDNGGRHGGNTGFNPYAAAPQPFTDSIENYWSAPITKDYGRNTSRIYVVARDDRGGVAWTSATVTLR